MDTMYLSWKGTVWDILAISVTSFGMIKDIFIMDNVFINRDLVVLLEY